MKLTSTPLGGVYLAQSPTMADQRGGLTRLYCEHELAAALGPRRVVQVNHTLTRARGAVRGMHFQHPPHAEMKFVRCIKGRVWDVAVDIRAGSPTFLRWHAEELSPENGLMMIIPEGCAHGFQALEPNSEMLYLHTAFYAPASEGGFMCNDDAIGIRWPLPINDLSARDSNHPAIAPHYRGVTL